MYQFFVNVAPQFLILSDDFIIWALFECHFILLILIIYMKTYEVNKICEKKLFN